MTQAVQSPRWQEYSIVAILGLVLPHLFPLVLLIFNQISPWFWFNLIAYIYSPDSKIIIYALMSLFILLPSIIACIVTAKRGNRAGLRTAVISGLLSGAILTVGLTLFLEVVAVN
jgi:uncharacterized BrkB/YihY/UPF0761 family membrane protein